MAVGQRARTMLDRLQTQIQCQWKREPLLHPEMEFYLKVSNERSDRDGIITALLDLMQPQKVDGHVTFSGVILNDNVAQSNNLIVIHPADVVSVGYEESLIVLRESTWTSSEPEQEKSHDRRIGLNNKRK